MLSSLLGQRWKTAVQPLVVQKLQTVAQGETPFFRGWQRRMTAFLDGRRFYLTGEGAKYSRESGAGETAALMGSFNIGEAPWSVYTQEVKDSIASYGDAVIITLSRIGGEGYDCEFNAYNYLALSAEEKEMMVSVVMNCMK